MREMLKYLAEVETAILNGTWQNVLGAPPTATETWTTKANGWTVHVILDRKKGHQDGGAASDTKPLVMHLTPELVRLAVEQIDKVRDDASL